MNSSKTLLIGKGKAGQIRLPTLSMIIIAFTLSILYLHFAWSRYQNMAEKEALQLANSLEVLLPTGHILKLTENPKNQTVLEYRLVKEKLTQLVETIDSVHYAYITAEQEGELFVLVDSNPNYSSTYSPLAQAYGELNHVPLPIPPSGMTKPFTNKWGTWLRVLTPIGDSATEDGRLVLTMSFSYPEWQASLGRKMIPDIAIVICLLLLFLALLHLRQKHAQLQDNTERLAFQETLYRSVFEHSPIGITLVANNKKYSLQSGIKSINPMGEAILGRSLQELEDIDWRELTHEGDLKAELQQFELFVKGEIESYSAEKRLFRPDGSLIWVNIRVANFPDSPLRNSLYLCLIEDISARKESEEALRESERSKSVFLSHLPGMAYRCKYDRFWTMEFVSEGCRALTGYNPASLILNREISYKDLISPEYRHLVGESWRKTLSQREDYRNEYEIKTKSGEQKWVLDLGQGIYDEEGKVEAIEGIILDITEQKKKEHQIAYLKKHDFLTGLYNRNFMEQEKERLDRPKFWPLAVIVCDIDGLHMINNAFSHAEGDRLIVEVARLLQNCCRREDRIGRISGGEFMLLLPRTDSRTAHKLVRAILDTIESYNRSKKKPLYKISLSIGCSSKESEEQDLEETVRVAEENLRNRKLLAFDSSHSAIVSSIMSALYAKSQETEEHGQRLGQLCRMIGERLGLEQKDLDDLQLLSKLHDIGKISIENRILNKPGKLDEEEWKLMRQHPETGYHIAKATPQLEPIANYILHHHECWDGSGYPEGLRGPDIPLLSRILAIADAYDAMTEGRIYRQAMSREAALEEIRGCAGTKFDPDLAQLFIQLFGGWELNKDPS